jgi:hypothetical protein
MIINIITAIISVLCSIAFTVLNVILVKEARERELTFSEIIAENRKTKSGIIFMSIIAFPAALVLKTLTYKRVDTKSIYEMPKGYFVYIEEEGIFGTFAFNIQDYVKISNKLQINTEVNNDIEDYIVVKPQTLDGLCSIIDVTHKLRLKQINN